MNQQPKIKNKKIEARDQQTINNNINLLDEPLTIALVLRGNAETIQELKSFISQSDLELIYKTLGYGHLYITSKNPEVTE